MTNARGAPGRSQVWAVTKGDRPAFRCRLNERGGGSEIRHRYRRMFPFWDWVGGRYSMLPPSDYRR
jgi:hypothetical protein